MAPALAADIAGAGSTFAYPIYSAWGAAYKKETGVGLNYEPIGSSDGITKLQNKEVIFAASDMPLSPADLDTDGFVQFPTLTAGVVPVVNIDGLKPGELVLDGATLARIFLGEIKAWNDPPSARSIRTSSCRRAPSRWCIAPTGPARPSSSPII